MVVLSIAVLTKGGKLLLARQFLPMSRNRIESLCAAFPKLVEADSQHTFVETEDVRYVFQPLQQLYLVLVTNKQSNIMDDLDTLRMIAKLVGEYASATEEGICKNQFELIFALDELMALGHKEAVTLQQVKTYLEMDSHEEKLHQIIMESKMNEAREEARRKAEEIDKQKALLRESGFSEQGHGSSSYGGGSGSSSHYDADDHGDNRYGGSSSQASYTPSPVVSTPSRERPVTKKSKPRKGLKLKKKKKGDEFAKSFAAEEGTSEAYIPPTIAQEEPEEKQPARSEGAGPRVVFKEDLLLVMDGDSEVQKFESKGEMKLTVASPDDTRVTIHCSPPSTNDIKFKTPSKVNLSRWTSENVISLANPDHAWLVGSSKSTAVLKWRMAVSHDRIPLKFSLWADQEDDETLVMTLEYTQEADTELTNVILAVPCPSTPEIRSSSSPAVFSNGKLLWNIGDVNPGEEGKLEFVVETDDQAVCHPIVVKMESNTTFAGLQVEEVQRGDGSSIDFSQDSILSAAKFHIVQA